MPIRTIIVEDEFHQRATLQQKLEEHCSDIEIVAALDNAEDALIQTLRLNPDLLFVDIQLLKNDGVWLVEQLNEAACPTFTPPAVIFTTAFTDSQYLLQAFKVAAIDYLVKPVGVESLVAAVDRFRKKTAPSDAIPQLMDALDKAQVMRFRDFNGVLLLRDDDIAYIKADGNYSELGQADGTVTTIFERLGELERKLTGANFARTGKSIIINKRYIRALNARKNTVRLSTPQATFDVNIPEAALKALKSSL